MAKQIEINAIFQDERVKDKVDIEEILGMRMNMAEYFRLRMCCMELSRIFGPINSRGASLDTFMREKRRGGGALRKMLSSKVSNINKDWNPRTIPSAITLWGAEVINADVKLIQQNFNLWGISRLSSEFRNFLFKFVHGRLYLNNVLRRIDGQSDKCTFCTIVAKRELEARGIAVDRPEFQYYLDIQPQETVDHLFWSCEKVNIIVQQIYRWIRNLDWYRGNETISKKSFFQGISHEWSNVVQVDLIWKHYVKFQIFMYRGKKKLPTFPNIKHELDGIFSHPRMGFYRDAVRHINLLYTD